MMASDAASAGAAVAGEAVKPPQLTTYRLPTRTALPSVSDEPWTTYKPIIQRLYIEEQRPLKEVMQIMEAEHGFRST